MIPRNEASHHRALAWTLNTTPARTIDWELAKAQFHAAEEPIWLHLAVHDDDAAHWLMNDSGLLEVATSALLSEETRPRVLCRDNRMLLTLRGADARIAENPADLISLRFWTDGTRLVSTYLRPLACVSELHAELDSLPRTVTLPALLIELIEGVVDSVHDTLVDLEDRVIDLEHSQADGASGEERTALGELRKQLISLRRYLTPQRDALERLASSGLPWLNETHRVMIRECSDRAARYVEQLDESRDRAALAQEEILTRLSEATSRRSYLFAVVATLFLPLGFITGLLGINVGGMPGVENEQAFWWVAGSCAGLGAALWLVFRSNRWL